MAYRSTGTIKPKPRSKQTKRKAVSGGGGLTKNHKLNLKLALPLIAILALVGGYTVFRSFAANDTKNQSFSVDHQQLRGGKLVTKANGSSYKLIPANTTLSTELAAEDLMRTGAVCAATTPAINGVSVRYTVGIMSASDMDPGPLAATSQVYQRDNHSCIDLDANLVRQFLKTSKSNRPTALIWVRSQPEGAVTSVYGIKTGMNSNKEFLKFLYSSCLDRTPDQGGLTSWLGRLDSGASQESVLEAFINTPEAKSSAHCQKVYGEKPTPPPAVPCVITADKLTVSPGESTTIRWSSPSVPVVINGENMGSVKAGQLNTGPLNTTRTFKLIGGWDSSCTRSVSIGVVSKPLPPSEVACKVTSNVASISAGQSVTLTWSSSGGSNWGMYPNIGTIGANGSRAVSPTKTTEYVYLVDYGSSKMCLATTKVVVIPAPTPRPATCAIAADKPTIKKGESTIIRWKSSVTPVAINGSNFGSAKDGQLNTGPLQSTTTYTLMSGSNPSCRAAVKVTVTP